MADLVIDKRAADLEVSDRFDGYSRVVIKTGETGEDGNEIAYIAGNETGRTLEIENPWANQTVADNILAKIQGWAYQPIDGSAVSINPAFEVGDSIVINNTFSGVYESRVRFSRLYLADVKAPADKEINHEYAYEDSKERKYTRKINNAVARLNFYADKIEAKVDKVNENATFGWRLTEDGWAVFNQNGTLFSVDGSRTFAKGTFEADSGKIGGFTIGSRGIYNNQSSFGGQEATGVYIGTDGIQLGTKFRVDNQGNLYAENGYFNGNVYAKNIQYGGSAGYFSGSGILGSSLGTPQFMQGVINSLGYADFANEVFNNRDSADYINCKWAVASKGVSAPIYFVDSGDEEDIGRTINKHTHYVKVEGNKVTIGAPDFSGATHPFEIASAVDGIVLDGVTYVGSYNVYAISVKAVNSNGDAVATETLRFSGSEAYSAGQDNTDVNWSDGDYDIWVDGTQDVYGHRFAQINVKLTNGKVRQSAWLDCGHI